MKSILALPPLKSELLWQNLYGASLSLTCAELLQKNSGTTLLITTDNLSAMQLFDELNFFLADSEQRKHLFFFPDWETLPYDQFSPHQDLISERLKTLTQIKQNPHAIVISAISTLMHRLCPPMYLQQSAFHLQIGQAIDREAFRQQLQQAGYFAVNKVMEHGEFALRGSIIDVFPMGSKRPFRIELLDDEIESLRYFDADSQRTTEKSDRITILPAREFPNNEQGITLFRRHFREQFPGNPSQCPIYESVSEGHYPGGIEYYLPFFFEEPATIFDYLPEKTNLLFIKSVIDAANQFEQEVKTRFQQRAFDVSRPIINPEQVFLTSQSFFTLAKPYSQQRLSDMPIDKKGQMVNLPIHPPEQLPIDRSATSPLHRLIATIEQSSERFLLVVESAGRREALLDLLSQSHLSISQVDTWQSFIESDIKLAIITGPLLDGCVLHEAGIHIIVEAQLFGEQPVVSHRKKQGGIDPNTIIRDLAELKIGNPVVHINFGVGRYQGLKTLQSGGVTNEFVVLNYAGDDKIYVPITSLHVISRYTGGEHESAPLHRLGSDTWQKEKKKAAEKIHDVAIELLDIYAKRQAKSGFSYEIPQMDYHRFASGFPFEETDDQKKAIAQIQLDMKSPRPMDRLICGDVGFGKTEVAMRAAFIAVQNSKQVCILVPTTLLAGQHFDNFRDRFADFPVSIELLSRFRSAKESEAVINKINQGLVDIVIGTHKLFTKLLNFKRLGLLIIDEEHRFGVKQKEYIKSIRNEVDILSMTATPIPRTLNMAMSGIRDISLIATPPAKRLAVKTFWQNRNNPAIREAILREILRGGQVYFLHNNVQTINRILEEVESLVPEAKVRIAHGQMKERELERIMNDFYHHRFNVLVCTTIIETGIDVPTANTIIIDRADKLGLAQLHQLRGRVGRSHHQAYAYLFTPDEKIVTPDAKKRLEAIVSFEDLGAGFALATQDLEIRGAGELLGEEQSGSMHAIGFTLFMDMLDKAVNDLKAGKTPELEQPFQTGPEIELRISAIIPENFIPDIQTRLIFYKRIANAQNQQTLHDLQVEMIDRFGLLPEPVKHLFRLSLLKITALQLGITRIQGNLDQGKIEFCQQPMIDPGKLISLIQLHPKRYQLQGPQILKCQFDGKDANDLIDKIDGLLKSLALSNN
ncbi:transcription-repair coupling factor [Legionella sp. W05-934-2]|uniref:transcription-repair coupling factor n=1 Tax=Legionella sp. W05-934-2 TaxID=1198649 RepID=UPI003461B0A9